MSSLVQKFVEFWTKKIMRHLDPLCLWCLDSRAFGTHAPSILLCIIPSLIDYNAKTVTHYTVINTLLQITVWFENWRSVGCYPAKSWPVAWCFCAGWWWQQTNMQADGPNVQSCSVTGWKQQENIWAKSCSILARLACWNRRLVFRPVHGSTNCGC